MHYCLFDCLHQYCCSSVTIAAVDMKRMVFVGYSLMYFSSCEWAEDISTETSQRCQLACLKPETGAQRSLVWETFGMIQTQLCFLRLFGLSDGNIILFVYSFRHCHYFMPFFPSPRLFSLSLSLPDVLSAFIHNIDLSTLCVAQSVKSLFCMYISGGTTFACWCD